MARVDRQNAAVALPASAPQPLALRLLHRVPLALVEIVERIDATQRAGVDRTHVEVADIVSTRPASPAPPFVDKRRAWRRSSGAAAGNLAYLGPSPGQVICLTRRRARHVWHRRSSRMSSVGSPCGRRQAGGCVFPCCSSPPRACLVAKWRRRGGRRDLLNARVGYLAPPRRSM
jgi:hypothetical protein